METEEDYGTNMENPPEVEKTLVKSAKGMEDKPEDKKASLKSTNEEADKRDEGNSTVITLQEGGDKREVGMPTEILPNMSRDTSGKERSTEVPPTQGGRTPEDQLTPKIAAKETGDTGEAGRPTEIPLKQGEVKPEDKIDSVSAAKEDADTSEAGKPTETTPNGSDGKTKGKLRAEKELEVKPEDKIDSVSAAKEDADTSEAGKPTETTPNGSDGKTKGKLRAEKELEAKPEDKIDSVSAAKEDADTSEVGKPTETTPPNESDGKTKGKFRAGNEFDDSTDGRMYPGDGKHKEQRALKILMENCEKCKKSSKENEDLRTKISELETTEKHLKKVIDKMAKENEKNQSNLVTMNKKHIKLAQAMAQKDIANQEEIQCLTDKLSRQTKRNKEELKRRDEEIKKKDEIAKTTINWLKNENDDLNTEHAKQIGKFSKTVKEQNDTINSCKNKIHEDSLKFKRLSYQHESILSQMQKLQEDYRVLNGEKQDLLLRLSKVAGANLTYNNPNIADLSDENRPTKLAEEFSELYDNEWTDAFEVLPFEEDEQKTKYMINILEEASRLCSDLSNGHDKRIKDSLRILTTKVYINRRDRKLSVGEKDENLTQSDMEAVTPFEPPKVRDGETNTDKGENTDVINKDNNKQRDLNGGKSSNEKEGNAVKEHEVEHSDKDTESDKNQKEHSVVSKNDNDEKGDFEEGTSTHENGGNVAKEPTVEHSDKDTEADKIKKVNSVNDNDKQGDFEAGTSSNENGGNVAKNDNNEKGDFEEETSSDENGGTVEKNDNDEKGDFEEGTSSNENGGNVATKDNFEAEPSVNEHVENAIKSQPKSSNEMNIHREDQETIKAETEVVQGDRDTKSDKNKDEISDESKKENGGEVDTNQYDENTIEITMESDFDLLSKEQKKTIMEAKNFFEIELTNKVETTVTDLITKSIQMKMESRDLLETYIKKCVSICWLMCRHNPPVFIEFPDVKENIPFDTNKYKPYTRSGKIIDHIVWPALHLHEGGPLLCKGVAQGIVQKDCNKLCK